MATGSQTHDASELVNAAPNNAVTSGLRSLWEQELLIDYTIQVGDHKFPVHKVVMASVSDYFSVMLAGTTRMSESQGSMVMIEGVSADIMQILIDFIYKTQLDITKENASEVLAGAMYLQIQSAVDICTKFMLKNINAENWFDLLSLFRSLSLWNAAEEVISYVCWDIQEIVKQFDCVTLTYNDFWVFVYNWTSSGLDLFHFVKKWVDHDYEKRKEHLDELLGLVQYPLMTPTELSSIKEMEEYHNASQSLPLVDLVDKAISYHKLPVHQKVLDVSEQTQIWTDPTFITFAPEHTRGGCIYDYKWQRFIEYTDLKIPENFGKLTKQLEVNNYLVAHTKSTTKPPISQWYIFDPRTLTWTKMANLDRALNNGVLVHDNTHVYAVGGYESVYDDDDDDEYDRFPTLIDSIERYDFHTDTWVDFSTLPEQLKCFGACVLGNHLYVSGGSPPNDDYGPRDVALSIFHRLDLSTRVWETKARMLEARRKHSMQVMTILGEEVICIFDSVFNLEYYSPAKDQWARCTFSFSDKLPVETTNRMYRGNSCYLYKVTQSAVFSHSQLAYVLVEFPEEGKEVTVDYLPGYVGDIDYTVLSIAPHTKKLEV